MTRRNVLFAHFPLAFITLLCFFSVLCSCLALRAYSGAPFSAKLIFYIKASHKIALISLRHIKYTVYGFFQTIISIFFQKQWSVSGSQFVKALKWIILFLFIQHYTSFMIAHYGCSFQATYWGLGLECCVLKGDGTTQQLHQWDSLRKAKLQIQKHTFQNSFPLNLLFFRCIIILSLSA